MGRVAEAGSDRLGWFFCCPSPTQEKIHHSSPKKKSTTPCNIDLQRVVLLEDYIGSLSTFYKCIDFCPHHLLAEAGAVRGIG